jgi:hypothetical protein
VVLELVDHGAGRVTAAGLLLAQDTASLYPPSAAADEHGWALPGPDAYWTGPCNLQLASGLSDPNAAQGGGHGPYAPHAAQAGTLYLPPDCPLAEGSAAQVRGGWFVVSQARLITDPTGSPGGGASCWVATVAATAQWAADDGS